MPYKSAHRDSSRLTKFPFVLVSVPVSTTSSSRRVSSIPSVRPLASWSDGKGSGGAETVTELMMSSQVVRGANQGQHRRVTKLRDVLEKRRQLKTGPAWRTTADAGAQ